LRKLSLLRYKSDMLIEFRVENDRSIRDEQVLSMEAAFDKPGGQRHLKMTKTR